MIPANSFLVGIESVSDYKTDELAFYPELRRTSTLAKPIESELDLVIRLTPVDHNLVDLTKPKVRPEWLHPNQYQSTLSNVKQKLEMLKDTDCLLAKDILTECEQYQHYLNLFSGLLLKV